MALVVNLNGSPVGIRSLDISSAQGNQDTATFEYRTTDPAAIQIDDVITVVEDGVTIYGGTVKTVTVQPYGDSNVEKNLKIDTVDFNERATRQIIFGLTIPGGTELKPAVEMVLEHVERAPGLLTEIHASWTTDGPSIGNDDLVFDDTTPDMVMRALEQRTGWLGNIEYNEKIWFYAPGTRAAPWNIAPGDGNMKGFAVLVRTRDKFYNRIVLKFSEEARAAYAFFTMTVLPAAGKYVEISGTRYHFVSALAAAHDVFIELTIEGTLSNLIDTINAGYDPVPESAAPNSQCRAFSQSSTSVKVSAITPGASGNNIAVGEDCDNAGWFTENAASTAALTFGFDQALTGRVTVDDATSQAAVGIYTGTFEAVDTFELDSATVLANLVLATSLQLQVMLKYTSLRGGLFPGMTQSIEDPSVGTPFDSAVSCLITDINTFMTNEGPMLKRDITVVYPGTFYRGSHWRDLYKLWSGETSPGGVSGGSVGGGGGSTTILGTAVYLLQGSAEVWVESPTPTWVPASGNAAGEGNIEYIIDTAVRGNSLGVVYVRLRALSGTVRARLWDITSGLQVGISTVITSTTFVNESFPVTFTTGEKRYRLELLPGTANVGVNGVGYLQ